MNDSNTANATKRLVELEWLGNTKPTTFDDPSQFQLIERDSENIHTPNFFREGLAPINREEAGWYQVEYTAKIEASLPLQDIEIAVFINATKIARDTREVLDPADNPSRFYGQLCRPVVEGDVVTIRVANHSTDASVIVKSLSFIARKV